MVADGATQKLPLVEAKGVSMGQAVHAVLPLLLLYVLLFGAHAMQTFAEEAYVPAAHATQAVSYAL